MANFDGKKDFTVEVQAAIPESISIAQSKGIDEAIALLLPLEKSCRVNNDTKNLREVNLHMVRLCRDSQNWDKLNAVLALINKRSSQYKTGLTAVVTEVMTYIDTTPTLEVKIALIKALKEVCEGKIFIEGESAHLHFMLAKIYEDRGEVGLACDTIQDVHVETYGSLSKKEKGSYILEQIRLNLLRKDFIRTAIQSRKMNLKTIEEEGFEEIKIRFYQMQIEYHTLSEKNPWEISQAYFKIAQTKGEAYESLRKQSIEDCITFLLLSKHDNHQNDMLFRVKTLLETGDWKEITISPVHRTALSLFTTEEIIRTPFDHQSEFEAQESLRRFNDSAITSHFLKLLRTRIIQHNIRVVAKYYQRIQLGRLGQLIQLNEEELEAHLSEMSFNGDVFLKIDRPNRIVSFEIKRSCEEVLSEWTSDLSKMMQLVETTCHLINRENMVHKL